MFFYSIIFTLLPKPEQFGQQSKNFGNENKESCKTESGEICRLTEGLEECVTEKSKGAWR